MVIENALLFSVSEMLGVETSEGANIIQIRPRLIRDLLGEPSDDTPGVGGQFHITITPQESLNKASQRCANDNISKPYISRGRGFWQYGGDTLGDRDDARKVQLRLNQLGLRCGELKERLP